MDNLRELGLKVATGVFGAHVEEISNDGSVTLLLDSRGAFEGAWDGDQTTSCRLGTGQLLYVVYRKGHDEALIIIDPGGDGPDISASP